MARPVRYSVLALATAAVAVALSGPGAASPTTPPALASSATVPSFLRAGGDPACPFTVTGRGTCSHGPDAPNIDPNPIARELRRTQTANALPTLPIKAPVCDGDGVSGKRVQVVYVQGASENNDLLVRANTFRQRLVDADVELNNSAAETGGSRHFRIVTDANCVISVARYVVPDSVAGDTGRIWNYLSKTVGLRDPNRKYLMFSRVRDCGIAEVYPDTSPGAGNFNNGFAAQYAMVGPVCWDDSYGDNKYTALHELVHTLGAVSSSAPHGTKYGHCFDGRDVMCYGDGPGTVMQYPCPLAHEHRLDCNHDDYFSTSATSGYLASNWNTANSDFLIGSEGDRFTPVTPARVLDTRTATRTRPAGPLVGGRSENVLVAGEVRVPANATAVVLSVAAGNSSSPGSYLTLWAAGTTRPLASNLNLVPGRTVSNQVVVKLGNGPVGGAYRSGTFQVWLNTGTTDAWVDVVGYYAKVPVAAQFTAVVPGRVLDSRKGTGGYTSMWGPLTTRSVAVTGLAGVPVGATAVVMNVTATNATANSFLSVWSSDTARPPTSTVAVTPGQTTPNLVTTSVGRDGKVYIYNDAGWVDVIADVVGYYSGSGSRFVPITPLRALDSRKGIGGFTTPWAVGTVRTLAVAGRTTGVPANATAVVLNVTAVGASVGSFLTVYPAGAAVPLASNLNFPAHDAVPNLVTVRLGTGGRISIFNQQGMVHVIADVVGYFVPSAPVTLRP